MQRRTIGHFRGHVAFYRRLGAKAAQQQLGSRSDRHIDRHAQIGAFDLLHAPVRTDREPVR